MGMKGSEPASSRYLATGYEKRHPALQDVLLLDAAYPTGPSHWSGLVGFYRWQNIVLGFSEPYVLDGEVHQRAVFEGDFCRVPQ